MYFFHKLSKSLKIFILVPERSDSPGQLCAGARAVYAMCSTMLLQGTIHAIDARRRAFIWTGDSSCNGGQCKAAWTAVCWDKDRGGLGVKNLAIQNRGLLLKFWAKLHQSSSTSWQTWFLRMYGPESGRDLGDRHYLDTPVWTMLLQLLPEFRQVTKVHLGDGQTTSFWFDHWLGPLPLAELMPALFSHSQRKNISVYNAWTGTSWDLQLSHRLSNAATEEWAILLHALSSVSSINLSLDLEDFRGIGEAMTPFSSSAFYAVQMEHRPQDPFAGFIWKNTAVPRCKHFLWLIHHDRLPSAALLCHRNIIDSAICFLCGAHEDQDHILLRCPRARRVWRLLNWSYVPYLRDVHDLWSCLDVPLADAKVHSAIITAFLWNIWKGRNAWVFNGIWETPDQVIRHALSDIKMWMKRMPSALARAPALEFCDTIVI